MSSAPSGRSPRRPSGPAAYRERLWPGLLGWSGVVGFAVFMVIAVLPVRPAAALVAGALTLLAGLVVLVRTSPVVEVAQGELRAGSAHIPVALVADPVALDRDQVAARLGPGSDARAHMCLRAWIPGAVEVSVVDPQDPTPTWLVSSRRPDQLAAAITAARTGSQAAHSEQTG